MLRNISAIIGVLLYILNLFFLYINVFLLPDGGDPFFYFVILPFLGILGTIFIWLAFFLTKKVSSQNIISSESDEIPNPEPKEDVVLGNLLNKSKNKVGEISVEKALNKLKKAKEHLELELIDQNEYDELKKELSPIILNSQINDANDKVLIPKRFQFVKPDRIPSNNPKKISTFEQLGASLVAILLLGGLLFAAMVIKDDTRCDNTGPFPLFTGCEYRKEKIFMSKYGLTGSGHYQKNYDKNVHALKGKEFCSNYCAKDWYRKL